MNLLCSVQHVRREVRQHRLQDAPREDEAPLLDVRPAVHEAHAVEAHAHEERRPRVLRLAEEHAPVAGGLRAALVGAHAGAAHADTRPRIFRRLH